MHQDVDAAIAWLAAEKKTPTGKIVLLGASFSCSVAIDTTVLNPDPIAAVVCLTPNGTVGDAGFGMPTMDRLPKWPHGKPLLAVSSDEDAVFSLELLTKLGDDARMRKVADSVPVGDAKARSIRGTDMFGRVPDVEDNVADWIALHVAFRRVDLGDGVTAVLGSTGTALYVGVETPPGAKTTLDALAVRVGLGPVTDPWSKSETIEVGKRLSGPTEDAAARRRTRIARDRLGAESGKPFAVQISLDGRKFLPAAGEPALLFSLR
jgi:hypothetical protein